MNVRERYQNDVVFHRLVDGLRQIITEARLTPSEIREAATFACIIEEERRGVPTDASCTCLSIGRDPLCWFHGDRRPR